MSAREIAFEDLPRLVGQTLGASDWIEVDQAKIDAFAEATGDHQWIHVDVPRAAAGPFGTTVAHGYLTLSLLPAFAMSAFQVTGSRMGVNYGLDRVRFPAPVPAGSRLRAHFTLKNCESVEGGVQVSIEATVEREGSAKPVCVAQMIARRYA
jgi:acyl dehydratase